jgi:hypothetical protein
VAAAFFVGGIGRLLAVLLDGPPRPFYVAMPREMPEMPVA